MLVRIIMSYIKLRFNKKNKKIKAMTLQCTSHGFIMNENSHVYEMHS